ncbi:MAG TPA: nucleotide pyrophosphohydrolase [Candidatus Bathyarchaeota archaeon]|nr:nucleotide pyrophosphohydrolase [Candidatus Bathyarchaeota archaeon]
MHVREAQAMMRRIYYHKDSKRGAEGTWRWLLEEVEELGEAIRSGDERAIRDEFADVLAWLASLANVVGVDLEEAFSSKYPGHCPKCGRSVCMCPT